MNDPTTCAVIQQAELVAAQAQSLNSGLHKLRKMQKRHCNACPHNATCHTRQYWNSQIDTAIREVATTWGLIP